MAHQNPEHDHYRGSRGRGFTLQSLPGSDSTAHDSTDSYISVSLDPFQTLKNTMYASSEAGAKREKSEALLNNDWRHNRRPRAETEALPPGSDLLRASCSARQQPRFESDILTCERIKDTPVDPEMIKSAPVVGQLRGLPDKNNDGHDGEEAPIPLYLDSLEKDGYEVISHTRRTDDARHLDGTSNPELFASFAVKPFDDAQQDSEGSSLSCLLRRNSKEQRFKARGWNTFAEEEWTIISSAVATSRSHLLSASQRKLEPKEKRVMSPAVRAEPPIDRKWTYTGTPSSGRSEDDDRYRVCILDKLQKKPASKTSGISAIPKSHARFKTATENRHGEAKWHSSHDSNNGNGGSASMDAAKGFKWNPNAPEFATCPPSKPPPATIPCSDLSGSRSSLMGAFDPALMPGGSDPATMPGGFNPAPLTGCFDPAITPGGFDPAIMQGGFDPATMMGGFDSTLPRGVFDAGNGYRIPVADHTEGTVAETCARLRNMLDQLEVTAANQAERDRYLNSLSKALLPGAAQQIPGLQTHPSTRYHTGLQARPAVDGVFPPRTTMPFVEANSQLFPEPGAMVLPSFAAPVSNGAGQSLPSAGPNTPFHAAPLPASAGAASNVGPNSSVPTFSSLGNSNPVGETPKLQSKGSRQSNTLPNRRGRGAASDPVPCHPIFGPKPVEKPKGPPRPHDPLWNRQQQMYEAWLEWQRSINPARHLEGKERQNKRNERRLGSRRSESEGFTKAENEKPQDQVAVH